MVVGLDIAAGVAGLITLADVAADRIYRTIQACRHAGEDSQKLLREVQALLGVLSGLKRLSARASNSSLRTFIPPEQIYECEKTLDRVKEKLVKSDPEEAGISFASKWKRILKWPISSKRWSGIKRPLTCLSLGSRWTGYSVNLS
jgi:hypothetical protein